MARAPRAKLTHTSPRGAAAMVDVSAKPPMHRVAVAEARIALRAATVRLLRANRLQKGDVLAVARVAGIQAAKQTQLLIPLCHQLPLARVAVDFAIGKTGVRVTATVTTVARTGVEMEALTAASIAALTIYDMCKAADQTMRVDGVRLVAKTKTAV
jgi:cyclic pyranopterin phosphate synthase